jgi:hypothetical protein
MKERPLIFTAESVRNIIAGIKTHTRRVVKFKKCQSVLDHDQYKFVYPAAKSGFVFWTGSVANDMALFTKRVYEKGVACPYGVPGDRLWVKEPYIITPPGWSDSPNDYNIKDEHGEGRIITYCATAHPDVIACAKTYHLRVRPARYMPRWASRLTLEIVDLRVERLQDISQADAKAEGAQAWYRLGDGRREIPHGVEYSIENVAEADRDYVRGYQHIWDCINAKRGHWWHTNPWVWVIQFKLAA